MKKKIINIFLAVAIALMAILFYNCFMAIFNPIHLETKYTRTQRTITGNITNDSTQTYIFHADGTFDEIVIQDGEEERGYGLYVIDEDTIYLSFLKAPYWQTEKFTMKIQTEGEALSLGDSVVYKSGFHLMALYAVLTGTSEIILIIAVFLTNKKSS